MVITIFALLIFTSHSQLSTHQMTLRIFIAFFHILTLGIGFYAIWTRANALKKLKDPAGLAEVFRADNIWGLASMFWIGTGLWRAFGGLEKGTQYYLNSSAFILKMSLFLAVFILEIAVMITLIKWRGNQKRGEVIDLSPARGFVFISHIQLGLISSLF